MQASTLKFSYPLGALPKVLNVSHVLQRPVHQVQQHCAHEAHISEQRHHSGALLYHANDPRALSVCDYYQRTPIPPRQLSAGSSVVYSPDMNARLTLYMPQIPRTKLLYIFGA